MSKCIQTALYASCLVGNMVEQLWNFASPASIAMIHPSLLPVALMGFFAKVFIIKRYKRIKARRKLLALLF